MKTLCRSFRICRKERTVCKWRKRTRKTPTPLPHSPTLLLRQGLQRVQSKPEKQWQVPQKASLLDLTVWLPPGLWENRKMVGKIIAALAALLMLPILFLLMLPSLIFGTDGLDNASGEVLNDTSLIMENIAETENSIETHPAGKSIDRTSGRK